MSGRWRSLADLTVENGSSSELLTEAVNARLRYRIRAFREATPSDWSDGWREVDNRLPEVPSGINTQVHNNRDITVTWQYESSRPIVGFEVRRKKRRGDGSWTNWSHVDTTGASRTRYHDEAVRNRSRLYRYAVRGLNHSGTSEWSDYDEADSRRN